MDDTMIDETANCFVPEILVDYIDKYLQQGKEGIEPASFFLTGVCLLVDISGFTKLSGDFCNMGKSGIDELQLATNGYMGQLVEIIYTYGGEIIKFAGDAIICIFSSNFITSVEKKKQNGRLRRSVYDFHNIDMNSIINNINNQLNEKEKIPFMNINNRSSSNSNTILPLKIKTQEKINVPLEVIIRSISCANILKNIKTEKLSVHVAMSCGEMCFGILGGVENRWECLISGPCIHQLSECLDDAPSMTAVISPECAEVLHEHITNQTNGSSNRNTTTATTAGTTNTSIDSTDYSNIIGCDSSSSTVENCSSINIETSCQQQQPPLLHTTTTTTTTSSTSSNHKQTIHTDTGIYTLELLLLPSGNYRIIDIICTTNTTSSGNKATTTIKRSNPELSKIIRQFVPVPIADGLDHSAGLQYLAEIREVTTMFMKWDSYDAYGKHKNLLDLQVCFYQAQRILHTTGAYLRQFLVDDKGCVLIGCWGMPHLSYLDNTHRAVHASAQIRVELEKLGMVCSFGITTGDVYCGTVGSAVRMEYAAIGSVVNMAARLMCKANGGILIDDATHSRLPDSVLVSLQALDPMKVKGRDEPLQVYRYTASTSHHVGEKVVEDHEISVVCRNTLLRVVDNMAAVPIITPVEPIIPVSPAPSPQHTRTGSFSSSVKGWMRTTANTTSSTTTTTTTATSAKNNTTSITTTTTPTIITTANTNTREHRAISSPTAISSTGKLTTVLISGKDGSGRTTAVVWLKQQAIDRSIPVYNIRIGKKDMKVEYIVWKKVFQQLMPADLFLSYDTQRKYVRTLLNDIYTTTGTSTAGTTTTNTSSAIQQQKQLAYTILKTYLGITCGYGDSNTTSKRRYTGMDNPPTTISNTTLNTTSNTTSTSIGSAWGIGKLQPFKLKPAPTNTTNTTNLSTVTVLHTLYTIFAHLLNQQNSLIIIENIQYSDEDSLKFLLELTKLQTNSVFILTALLIEQKSTIYTKTGLYNTIKNKSIQVEVQKATIWTRLYKDIISKHKQTIVLVLENYSNEEIDRLLCSALGVQTVPIEIAQLVHDFSGGSYFWVREILQFIKEHGSDMFMSAIGEGDPGNTGTSNNISELGGSNINTSNSGGNANSSTSMNRKRISPHNSMIITTTTSTTPSTTTTIQRHTSIRQLTNNKSFVNAKSYRTLPGTVNNSNTSATTSKLKLDKLILCRFENLHMEAQHVLRTASIIGMQFSAIVLYTILSGNLKAHMYEAIKALLNQRWLFQDTDNEDIYQFAHIHAHQIIYELTPTSERSNIHATIATYLENTYSNDHTQYPALCYHYRVCDTNKALKYCIYAITTMLTTITSIYEYIDILDLLSSIYTCCITIYDIDVLMKIVIDVKNTVELFDLCTIPMIQKGLFHHIMKLCRGHTTTVVLPEESMIYKSSSTKSNDSNSIDTDNSNNTEKDNENKIKLFVLEQLEKLHDELCEKYVDVVDDRMEHEAEEWQRELLGLSDKGQSGRPLHVAHT